MVILGRHRHSEFRIMYTSSASNVCTFFDVAVVVVFVDVSFVTPSIEVECGAKNYQFLKCLPQSTANNVQVNRNCSRTLAVYHRMSCEYVAPFHCF